MDLQNIAETAIPIGEEVAALYIHNPASIQKYTAIFSTVNELEPLVAGLLSKLFAKKQPAALTAAQPAKTTAAAITTEAAPAH